MAAQQVFAYQVGIAVGILRQQPALVDQGDVDARPVQWRLCQRTEYRRRRAAAGNQQARTRVFMQVATQGCSDRDGRGPCPLVVVRSEEHKSELQSLMRNSYAVFCLK